jgi:hypothetical protein
LMNRPAIGDAAIQERPRLILSGTEQPKTS